MNLCGVLFIRGVLLTGLSIVLARGAPNLVSQPGLDVSFHPISGSVLRLEINNMNATTVNLLKWNSILEEFPVADLPFFLSTEPQSGPVEKSIRVHANYVKVLDSHFLRIGPLQRYNHDIELRKWFHITRSDSYRVRWNDVLRGFLGDEPLALEPLQRADIYKLPRIGVKSEMTVRLDRNTVPPQFQNTVQCGDDLKVKTSAAKRGAVDLAQSPYQQRGEKRRSWRQYFNGNDIIEDGVMKVYDNIRDYVLPRGGNSNSNLLRERCTIHNTAPCGPKVVSYQYQIERQSVVVFCPEFFTDLVAQERECEIPGPGNRDMFDRTGIYLRAFLRSDVAREGNPIKDGLLNTCYGFDCAEAVASNRDGSRFENSRYWGPPSSDGKPEDNAANYEQYAYAMRAKRCAINQPKLYSAEYCLKIKDATCTLIRNNRDILVGVVSFAISTAVSIGVSLGTSAESGGS